jgi:microcystin-dependent protein
MTNKVRRNTGMPSGVVFPFAGEQAPFGYLICQGQEVSRTEYASLFMAIGTLHGAGNGSTTFNLPDYRGNFLRGKVNISTVTGSGTATSNQATFTNHGINRTGFKVRLNSGTLSGLTSGTDYFAIVVNSNTLAFATTQANALANTRIAISGANSAVITQWEDADDTSRLAANVGGAGGKGVGSMQSDGFGAHRHIQGMGIDAGGAYGQVNAGLGNYRIGNDGNAFFGPAGVYTSTEGGGDTRPKNSLVNYIIKI